MQGSTIYILKKRLSSKYIAFAVRLFVFAALLSVVIGTFYNQANNWQVLQNRMLFELKFNPIKSILILGLVLGLVPLNWGLEAIKWQAIYPDKRNFISTYKAVLASTSAGLLLPLSIGNFVGMRRHIKIASESNFLNAVVSNSLVQTGVTYIFGIVGLIILLDKLTPTLSGLLLIVGLFIVVAIGLILANLTAFLTWLTANKILSRLFPAVVQLDSGQSSSILKASGWAALRYLVFTLQYLILLSWFGLSLEFLAVFGAVALTFMIKSTLPALNVLSDLGVREFSAMLAFGLIGAPEVTVIISSLTLWVANILLPAIAGAGIWLTSSKPQ